MRIRSRRAAAQQPATAQRAFVPATGWSQLLPWYDFLVACCAAERKLKAHLAISAAIPEQARVLDVGCGSGTLALTLKSQHLDARVTGVDVDPRMLHQARRKPGAEMVQWRVGNAVALDFPTASFDCVFCSLTLHHLKPEEKQQALSEMHRVLRPTGQLYLGDFCQPASWWANLRFLPARIIDGWQRTACNVQGRLPGLLRAAGFSVEVSLTLAAPLGTIRCFRCTKTAEQAG